MSTQAKAQVGNRSAPGGVMAAIFVVVGFLVPGCDRESPRLVERLDSASTDAGERDSLVEAESPHYPGEGAVGLLEGQENAGSAVNPITPTGRMGGPAGQTPAYGQPGGAPSVIVRQRSDAR